jgi:hypothetical protein
MTDATSRFRSSNPFPSTNKKAQSCDIDYNSYFRIPASRPGTLFVLRGGPPWQMLPPTLSGVAQTLHAPSALQNGQKSHVFALRRSDANIPELFQTHVAVPNRAGQIVSFHLEDCLLPAEGLFRELFSERQSRRHSGRALGQRIQRPRPQAARNQSLDWRVAPHKWLSSRSPNFRLCTGICKTSRSARRQIPA